MFIIEIGTTLDGRYEIRSCLGQGGMGVVYKAYDRLNQKFVAIKLINQERLNDPSQALRFKREAETASRLNHPSITKVLGFGLIDDAQPYLVMDFVEGKTLSALIAEEGQLPLAETLSIFAAVCDALAHAHENKVLHRDLKPGNIMINHDSSGTTVKILDFGIAKFLESPDAPSLHITQTGELLGSPFYMSPEQAKGGRIDHRSDLYSLGCTMYEALTGGPPHMGDNPMSTLLKRESHEPMRMTEASLGRNFPDKLEDIVAKLLKHAPADRYQSASDLKRDLLKVSEQLASPPEPANTAAQQEKSNASLESQKYKISTHSLTAVAVALLVTVCGTSFAIFRSHEQKPIVQQALEPHPAPVQEYRGQELQAEALLAVNITGNAADKLRELGKYEAAEQRYLEAIKRATSIPGNHDEVIADLRDSLAYNYMLAKQFRKASNQLEQIRPFYEKSLGPDNPRLMSFYRKLATNYRFQGKGADHANLLQAFQLYEKAEKYYEGHLPQTRKELLECLAEEASLFNSSTDAETKKRVLLKLLKFRTSESGPKHPQTLSTLADLAACCRQQGKYDDAIVYDKQWLAAYDDSPDEGQDDHVRALLTLAYDHYGASAWSHTSNLRVAEKLDLQALKLCQRDPAHFERQIAQAFESLGVTYQGLGQFDKTNYGRAERYNLQALAMSERSPNFDKHTIAAVLKRTADIQMAENHLDDAIATSLKALKLSSKVSGPNSKEVLDNWLILAECYRQQGKFSEATTYYEQILPLCRRYNGAHSLKTGDVLAAWAENTRIQGDFPKTRQLLIECLSIRRRTLGPKHRQTLWAETTLNYINDCLKKPANSPPATPETSNH